MTGLNRVTDFGLDSTDVVHNVKSPRYGAKGDGSTDDTTAIQNAINSIKTTGGVLYFPAGNYVIKQSLNLTDISNSGIIIKGSGRGSSGNGTTFTASTGGVLFDCTGTGQITFQHFSVVSGTSNPSTIAFLLSRSNAHQYAEFINMDNIYVDLATNPTANGNKGNVGIYNYGAELGRYRDIYIVADNPVIFSVSNLLNVSSTYTTVYATSVSMSEVTIDGSSTLIGTLNSACWLNSAVNIKLDNIYIFNSGTTTSHFAIALDGINTSISITGHFEGYTQTANITQITYGLQLEISKAFTSNDDQIVLSQAASGIYGGRIVITPVSRPNTYTNNLISELVAGNGVKNCIVTLDNGQKLNINGGYTTGNIYLSYDPSPSITESGSGYYGSLLIAQDKIRLHSPVEITDNLTINTNIVMGTAKYGYGGAAPTSGTWNSGDRVYNNFPTEQGTAGSMYIVEGWICTGSGSPGAWRPMRVLTGN